MRHDSVRKGDIHPGYEEIVFSPRRRGVHRARSSIPWWNARYWSKKVWIGVGIAAVVLIIIIIAVTVTEVKKNEYPNYSPITYNLAETFQGENFFDNFNYFTGFDPTGGFVHYVPEAQAKQLNLTYASPSTAVVRVDTSVGPEDNPNASTGRFSVRLQSKHTYNSGLFIFDIHHTPFGCGTWPALWLTDPSHWPDNGEIDVMEATNQAANGNQMTLHTTSGCSMGVRRKQTDQALNTDCNHADDKNAGCGVKSPSTTFGASYNAAGGGIMAMEWRDAGIRMWQFARNTIPSDITNRKPDPSTWGTAAADFPSTDCNIGSHFRNNSIILNIDLCGDLVYGVWSQSGCPSNCTDIVANQPQAFKDAYWEVGTFDIYQAS